MQWLKYAYCAFYLLFTIGNFVALLLARKSLGVPLPDVPSHHGTPQPANSLYFLSPPESVGILRSCHTTATTDEPRRGRSIVFSTIIGALIGFGAVWSFGVTAIWLMVTLVSITALFVGYIAFQWQHRHHCSFVGADGIYDTSASVTRNATSVSTITETRIPFDLVTDIYLRPDVSLIFARVEQGWTAPFKEGCYFRIRPESVTADDWDAFQIAAKNAFDEHLWSRALLQLAVSKLIDRNEPDVTPEAAFQAMLSASVAESGYRSGEGLFQRDDSGKFFWRLGCGSITFTLDSLLIYARNDGVFEADQRPDLELAPDDVSRVAIKDGYLCVDTASDGTLQIAIERCSRASVLVRLCESSIWTKGIATQIEQELHHDMTALKEADWFDRFPEIPYWRIIPGHRYAIWHAARLLKLPSLDTTIADRLNLQTGYGSGNPCDAFWIDYATQFSGWRARQAFEREHREFEKRQERNRDEEERARRFNDSFMRQLREQEDPGTPQARLDAWGEMLRKAEEEAGDTQ